eukprot:365708-Chlamydomonas_euryale.AAC.2
MFLVSAGGQRDACKAPAVMRRCSIRIYATTMHLRLRLLLLLLAGTAPCLLGARACGDGRAYYALADWPGACRCMTVQYLHPRDDHPPAPSPSRRDPSAPHTPRAVWDPVAAPPPLTEGRRAAHRSVRSASVDGGGGDSSTALMVQRQPPPIKLFGKTSTTTFQHGRESRCAAADRRHTCAELKRGRRLWRGAPSVVGMWS